jgi:hypothetical protein
LRSRGSPAFWSTTARRLGSGQSGAQRNSKALAASVQVPNQTRRGSESSHNVMQARFRPQPWIDLAPSCQCP